MIASANKSIYKKVYISLFISVVIYITLIRNELLFRHIFETQIHIQTQIRKTFILALTTNDFL